MGWRDFGLQSLPHLVFENPLHFVWRPGKQQNNVLAPIELPAQPLPGSGAVGIRQDRRTLKHIRLLRIVGRHLPAALQEALFQSCNNLGIAMQAEAEGFGYCLPREVVLGRSKTPAENDNIGAKQSVLRGTHQSP